MTYPLLARAESDRMSVRQLRHEIVVARRAVGERRGRPTLGATARGLSLLGLALQIIRDALGRLREQPVADAAAQAELQKKLADLGELIAEVSDLAGEFPSGVIRAVPEDTEWREQSA